MRYAPALAAVPLLALLLGPGTPASPQQRRPLNSCLECHEKSADVLKTSVHEKMACMACHGGDFRPKKGLSDEEKKQKAHSLAAPDPFVAVPDAKCAVCHKNEAEALDRGAHGLTMKSLRTRNCKQCHAKDLEAPSAHTIRKISFEPGGFPGRPRTGVDTTFAHRIGLFDAKKKLIDGEASAPYSPMTTCGRCHDYKAVSAGRHFEAGREGAEDGRPGEPWILRDAETRTTIPLSYRPWPGTRRPEEIGMPDWDFALRFGTHHPGGGPLEWLKDGRRRDAMEERGPDGMTAVSNWSKGGVHAIDCLQCHLVGPYNREERANQLRAGQFRFAPAAGAGFAAVIAEKTDEGPKPPGEGICKAVHAPSLFDPEGRVPLDVTRRPPARNCLACHAARLEGSTGGASGDRDLDVHLAAGMACTDCHRNGIDHQITRGDGGELDRRHHPDNLSLSCRGCHESGRLGAPPIPHRGLPAFHLEKLACTACHSGPPPADALQAVQTARSRGLGLIQDDLDRPATPVVQGPVFRPDGHGQIRPHYAVWPAWYGERKDGKTVPLPLARVKEAFKAAQGDPATPGPAPGVPAVLAKLKELGVADPVRVEDGRVLRPGGGEEAPEAEACFWPVAHAVRPAPLALGAGGCSDCHSSAAPFFFGTAGGKPMHRHLGLSPAAVHLGAAAVTLREGGMKMIAALLVLGLLVAAFAHLAAGARVARLLGVPESRAAGPAPDLGLALRWTHLCAWGLLLALVATGAGFLVTYGPSPLPSFFSSRHAVNLHVAAGLAFAVLGPLLAIGWITMGAARKRGAEWVNAWGGFLWMARGRGEGKILAWDKVWIWFDLLCVLGVALTGLVMAMRVPAVGNLAGEALRRLPDNHVLGPLSYAIHGMAGAALIGRLAMHLYTIVFLRRRPN